MKTLSSEDVSIVFHDNPRRSEIVFALSTTPVAIAPSDTSGDYSRRA